MERAFNSRATQHMKDRQPDWELLRSRFVNNSTLPDRGPLLVAYGPPPEELQLIVTDDFQATDTVNADQLQPGGSTGLNLTGNGITVGVWDGGIVRPSHQEFVGRVTVGDGSTTLSDHGTHVAGIIGATGIVPEARGVANKVKIISYDVTNDINEIQNAPSSLLLSNHSYGTVNGWIQKYWPALGKVADAWMGDRSLYSFEDPTFSKYDELSQALDQVLYNKPNYLSFWSAGNQRSDTFENVLGNNTYYTFLSKGPKGAGWYVVSTSDYPAPPEDGNGGTGYDSLRAGKTVAKNGITVGAINGHNVDPYTKGDIVMTDFAAWGPTDDGRIKPDLVADGYQVYSTGSASNTTYSFDSGTSFATPAIAGTAALLYEYYKNLFGTTPLSATTKGLLIHTAFDAGNVGPDYSYGWGVVDGAKAAQFLTGLTTPGTKDVLIESTYTNQVQGISIASDGTTPLKATIVWTDPPGIPQGAGVDVPTPVLVNDLDIKITGPDGTVYYPWTLDKDNPSAPALRIKANHLDNVEQVLIDQPKAGNYIVSVGSTGSVPNQNYSLLLSGTKNLFTSTYNVADNSSATPNGIAGYNLLSARDQALAFDYNGDKKDDLLLYRPGTGAISVVTSNGKGSFTTAYKVSDNGSAAPNGIAGYNLLSTRDQVVVFDYNGDSKDDILLYRPGTGAISVVRSNGNGSFTSVYSISDNGAAVPNGIAGFNLLSTNDRVIVFDYNGDGKDDLLLTRPGSGQVSVAKSNGNGSFTSVYSAPNGIAGYNLASASDKVAVFDYNGDGKDDLLLYRPGSGLVSVARSNGNGSFTSVYSAANGIGGYNLASANDQLVVFDYNGDGKDDLLLYRPGRGAISVVRSNGNGTFTSVYSVADNGSALPNGMLGSDLLSVNDRVVTLDYNKDRKDDLLFYRPGKGAALVAKSNGNGFFSTAYLVGDNGVAAPNGIGAYDLLSSSDRLLPFDYNGDARDDLFLYRPGRGAVSVVRSNSAPQP